jgi:dTDP-4-dehydrorhamnose reductase
VRVLITGAGGQLATALVSTRPPGVVALAVSHTECDITARDAIAAAFAKFSPEVVINTAAFTAVDRAEIEPDRAFAVNEAGVQNLADATQRHGVRLIHISTDYVFGGERAIPYTTQSVVAPVNVYGVSKAAGEKQALEVSSSVVVRTGWLYSVSHRSFLRSMLTKLRAGDTVRVVNDQIGGPTAAKEFADALWWCAGHAEVSGLKHWANSGSASWFDFAVAIRAIAFDLGLVPSSANVEPIRSDEYPYAARRPSYSVLDCSGTNGLTGHASKEWRHALRDAIRAGGEKLFTTEARRS